MMCVGRGFESGYKGLLYQSIKQNRIANWKVLARKMHELRKYEAKNSEKDLEEKLQRHSRNGPYPTKV